MNTAESSVSPVQHPEHSSEVVDISKSLSSVEIGPLKRGLIFCPKNNAVNEYELHKGITEFSRRLRIK